MLDLQHFVKTKGGALGIDRTFNLGLYFVTTFVYKNRRVNKKETKENPLFLGPLFLHKDASYRTYRSFFAHIAAELELPMIGMLDIRLSKEMVIGSDNEKALTKAIENTFPEATRLLCTKHLKDNIRHYMRDNASIVRSERKQLTQMIFGENGLVNASDDYEFEERAIAIREATSRNKKFNDYFLKQLKPTIRDFVYKPRMGQKDRGNLWTNNNTESVNNVIKTTVQWRTNRAADLIMKLHDITFLQFEDLKRALYGMGNYYLATNYKHYRIPRQNYGGKGTDEKKKIFMNFLKDKKRSVQTERVTSTNGKFSVPRKSCKVARKPGQRRRPRSEKTSKRF